MNKFFCRYICLLLILGFMFCSFPIPDYQVCAKDNAAVNVHNKKIKVGGYTLECGKYKGYEIDYDYSSQKPYEKEVIAQLKRNEITINGITTKFKVKGNKLYIGKQEMYEVTGNNKLLMLAGGGIKFEYEQ